MLPPNVRRLGSLEMYTPVIARWNHFYYCIRRESAKFVKVNTNLTSLDTFYKYCWMIAPSPRYPRQTEPVYCCFSVSTDAMLLSYTVTRCILLVCIIDVNLNGVYRVEIGR